GAAPARPVATGNPQPRSGTSRTPFGHRAPTFESHLRKGADQMTSSHSAYRGSDSEAFWGAGALVLGFLVAVLGFVSLMMWIDARNARDDVHRSAPATSTTMAGMPGMTGSSAAAAGALTSYAGAAPANAD